MKLYLDTFDVNSWQQWMPSGLFNDAERAERNAMQTCIGRNGKLEDIDGPLLFLCSDASAYGTGQILMVDGGFTAK